VKVGLWATDPEGWRFHAWLEFQPAAEQIEAERAAARDRMARVRANRKGSASEVPPNIDRSSPDVRLTPAQPGPARPSPTPTADGCTPAAACTPAERRRLLTDAAAIIAERAAIRPGTRDPTATARAVARGVITDRHQDAYAHIAAHPTVTAAELAEHLEPATPLLRPLPPTSADERIADMNPPPPQRIPDEVASQGLANVAALRQKLHPPEDDHAA
jgi:hypothetical protein